MGDLRGKTKTGVGFQFAARIDVRQDHFHAQAGEERRVERKQRMRGQRLGHADAPALRCGQRRCAGRRSTRLRCSTRSGAAAMRGFSFPDVLIQAAAAAEREAPAGDFETVDAAVHRASAAGEATGAFHLRRGQGQKIRRGSQRLRALAAGPAGRRRARRAVPGWAGSPPAGRRYGRKRGRPRGSGRRRLAGRPSCPRSARP